jgi:hypothetical protein
VPEHTDTDLAVHALTAAAACRDILSSPAALRTRPQATAFGDDTGGGHADPGKPLININVLDYLTATHDDLIARCSAFADALNPAHAPAYDEPLPAEAAAAYTWLAQRVPNVPDYETRTVLYMADRHHRRGLLITSQVMGRTVKPCPKCTKRTVVADIPDSDRLVCLAHACDVEPGIMRSWRVSDGSWKRALTALMSEFAGYMSLKAIAEFYREPVKTWETRVRRAKLEACHIDGQGRKYYTLADLSRLVPSRTLRHD